MSGGRSDNPWIVQPRPNSRALIRLFCFPFAGGTAHVFRSWPQGLPASFEVCSIQLPGRGGRIRETPFSDVNALVQAAVPMMLPYLDKPFAFFGHSMGAVISFEIARQLRQRQLKGPIHLYASGRRAPQSPASRPPTYALPEPEFIDYLQRMNGTPKEVLEHPQLMSLMLPLLRADFAVSQAYAYREGPPLDCPITACGGMQDGEVDREELEAWRDQTTAAFSLRLFQGDHFFLQSCQTELLDIISRELSQDIERVSSAP
jgi:medium-chain acyl-[acyl-carrier-protein] hydrolase